MKKPGTDRSLQALVDAAHDAHAEKLVVSSSGNFSVRVDSDHFAVSAARKHLGRLQLEDVVVMPVAAESETTEAMPGGLLPSRETPMHRAMYEARPDLGSFLHFQSLAATALACRAEPFPDLNFLPEVAVYIRRVGDVPYHPPGSDALAKAVVDAFRDPEVRLVQLRNHGQVVLGDTPAQAVERAVFFELAARVFLFTAAGNAPRRFSTEELRVLWAY